MPPATPLTDVKIRQIQPKEKPFKVFDGGGLYLEIFPDNAKRWRYKYRFGGREKRLALGVYPEISLKEARFRHAEARKLVSQGLDPSLVKQATQEAKSGANSFEAIANEWLKVNSPKWSERYIAKLNGRLRLHILPWIGNRPIAEITPKEVLDIARRIESKGHNDTAHSAVRIVGQIIDYAIQSDRASMNPARSLKGALAPLQTKHRAAITDPSEIGRLLLAIEHYHGNFVTKCALKLSALLFMRPGELRKMEWSELDFAKSELRLPIERMKRKQTEKNARRGEIDHIVPLSSQALEVLKELYQLTGTGRYVFPHARKRDRTMSDATVLNALRTMGYDKETMCAHGFRRMASTNLYEQDYTGLHIEKQLAHTDPNRVRAAYNDAAQYLEQRRQMMQEWADWLDARCEEARMSVQSKSIEMK